MGHLCSLHPCLCQGLQASVFRLYFDLSLVPNLLSFLMVGPDAFIYCDKKACISQGGVETHVPPAPALGRGLLRGAVMAVFLGTRPGPTVPHTLQSESGEATRWMGSLHTPQPQAVGSLEPARSQLRSPKRKPEAGCGAPKETESLLFRSDCNQDTSLDRKHILPGT